MTRDKAAGLTLIVGTVGLLVTMGLHPTGGSIEHMAHVARFARIAHSLAIASLPLMLLGGLGLTVRLKADPVLAPAAFVVFAIGCLGGMLAAVVNGLVAPTYAEWVVGEVKNRTTDSAILHYGHALGAAFANIYMIATAVATLLWSAAILRSPAMPSWAGWLGMVLGALALVAVLGGFLGLSVHEFSIFVLGISVWTIVVGALMCRPAPTSMAGGVAA